MIYLISGSLQEIAPDLFYSIDKELAKQPIYVKSAHTLAPLVGVYEDMYRPGAVWNKTFGTECVDPAGRRSGKDQRPVTQKHIAVRILVRPEE